MGEKEREREIDVRVVDEGEEEEIVMTDDGYPEEGERE